MPSRQTHQPVTLTQKMLDVKPTSTTLTRPQRTQIDQRLNAELKDILIREMGISDERISKQIRNLSIHYSRLRKMNMRSVIEKYVRPALEKEELDLSAVDHYLARSMARNVTVNAALRLDENIGDNPIFRKDQAIMKTMALAAMARVTKGVRDTLIKAEVDLTKMDRSMINNMVDSGKVSQKDGTALMRTMTFNSVTNDNPTLTNLLNKSVRSEIELVQMNKTTWNRMLTSGRITGHNGESKAQYIDTLMANVAAEFPTQYMVARMGDVNRSDLYRNLSGVAALFTKNPTLFERNRTTSVDWSNVPAARKARVRKSLDYMTSQVNTFRNLGFEDVLSNKKLTITQKRNSLDRMLKSLDKFRASNPELDLDTADFFNDRNESTGEPLSWTGVRQQDKEGVRKQMMAYQRMYKISPNAEFTRKLMERNWDSAYAISRVSREEMVNRTGLPEDQVDFIQRNAKDNAGKSQNAVIAIGKTANKRFRQLPSDNLDDSLLNDLKEIDGYDELFGLNSFCSCEHCRSIFSPAAYFVDLMYFRETHVSGVPANHAIHLKNRRPDLWNLELTCEKTTQLVPYLSIVNEVLEAYIAQISSTATYELLKDANSSLHLPMHLPLEEVRSYLGHFNLELSEVVRAIDENTFHPEMLGMSAEAYQLIKTVNKPGARVPFGMASNATIIEVPLFMKLTGLSRDQVSALIDTDFIGGSGSPEISRTEVEGELQVFVEHIEKLTSTNLDKINRFLRLWYEMPWSIAETDRLLTQLQVGNMSTNAFFEKLARVRHIAETTPLATAELEGLLGPIPYSYMRTHFGPKNFNSLIEEEKRDVLMSGLKLDATQLSALVELLNVNIGSASNGMLHKLFRFVALARITGFEFDEFNHVVSLWDKPFPGAGSTAGFDPVDLSDLLAFSKKMKSLPYPPVVATQLITGQVPYATSEERQALRAAIIKDLSYNEGSELADIYSDVEVIASEKIGVDTDVLQALLAIPPEVGVGSSDTSLDGIVNNLLDNFLTRLNLAAPYLALQQLYGWNTAQIGLFGNNLDMFHLENNSQLNLASIFATNHYYQFSTLNPEGIETLNEVLTSGPIGAADAGLIASYSSFEPTLVTSVLEEINTGTVLSLSNDRLVAMDQLLHYLSLCKETGTNGNTLAQLYATDYSTLQEASARLLAAINAKYDDAQLLADTLEPHIDKLNMIKRDALAAYIIAYGNSQGTTDLRFDDLDDLYKYFLLDVEMDGCARTSCVLAAISSLQVYIHRTLINLEQSASDSNVMARLDESGRIEWDWRRNYRVWEANRKVYLYPENYVEPGLRDNKSPEFKGLEEELLQQDITQEAAENAYKKYLSQFAQIGKLIVSGAYYETEHGSHKKVTFFARTATDPYQYYSRVYHDQTGFFTPWEKINVSISAPFVTAAKHMGKLFLFWVEHVATEQNKVDTGSASPDGIELDIYFNYSWLNESGQWAPAQKTNDLDSILSPWKFSSIEEYESAKRTKTFPKVYPKTIGKDLLLHYLLRTEVGLEFHSSRSLDLYNNKIGDGSFYSVQPGGGLRLRLVDGKTWLTLDYYQASFNSEAGLDNWLKRSFDDENDDLFVPLLEIDGIDQSTDMSLIQNTLYSRTYNLQQQQFLALHKAFKIKNIRISTSLPDKLGEVLFNNGIEELLSIPTQLIGESPLDVNFISPGILNEPGEPIDELPFQGSHGLYFHELYFHIPYLIANHLNSINKFKEAKHWYEKIFDPTAEEEGPITYPSDRQWQFVHFRGKTIQKLKDILVDDTQIALYQQDPFNPHAIARLRFGAYQKAIVMKYIDNILDWGDHLFGQNTVESINEATMLYIFARDILGDRPVEVGTCETAPDHLLTYNEIGPAIKQGSEFLIMLENLTMNFNRPFNNALSLGQGQHYSDYKGNVDIVSTDVLSFCIPENEHLLSFWDRVNDRLYKIRHCLDINGNKQQLPLFQPPIDPALLVKAKAAGLSLQDALSGLNASVPAYRFEYLVEKAKQYASTISSFGGALLAALEKKDGEELALLRSVHEQNILKLTEEVKKEQIANAESQLERAHEAKKLVEQKDTYYTDLIDEGLLDSESVQQIARHVGTSLKVAEGVTQLIASIVYLAPEVGSPFAMKYGGKQVADSFHAFAGTSRILASISDSIATSAGLEATFDRREQQWDYEQSQARQELKQRELEIISAEIDLAIAEKELQIHETQIAQSQELYDLQKDKFTNLGLYEYMSSTLSKLHREAYNVALSVARQAEQAWQFELDDASSFFIENDNWQMDKAGLLAGEKLTLQLQKMEQAWFEQNARVYEISQTFSLAALDPSQLQQLRESGSCEFTIPEWAYDLVYPGQYKRFIKSVRLTIPCVTGPYTNVNCKLALTSGQIRREAKIDTDKLTDMPIRTVNSIATSSANNDSGVFDLNFRDERYLPFEGAGAVNSVWSLELPGTFRSFNYDSISDVLIHISYTAVDGGNDLETNGMTFKEAVESLITTAFQTTGTLAKVFSARNHFAGEWHQAKAGTSPLSIEVTKNMFPHYMQMQNLKIKTVQYTTLPEQTDAEGNIVWQPVSAPSGNGPWAIDLSAVTNVDQLEDVIVVCGYAIV